jgi:hypothetical protein
MDKRFVDAVDRICSGTVRTNDFCSLGLFLFFIANRNRLAKGLGYYILAWFSPNIRTDNGHFESILDCSLYLFNP